MATQIAYAFINTNNFTFTNRLRHVLKCTRSKRSRSVCFFPIAIAAKYCIASNTIRVAKIPIQHFRFHHANMQLNRIKPLNVDNSDDTKKNTKTKLCVTLKSNTTNSGYVYRFVCVYIHQWSGLSLI